MTGEIVDVPVGTTARLTGPLGSHLTYRNEADLRDAYAALMWLEGWDVQTEAPTSTGGRADVVLRSANYTICVELKVDLLTQRQARLGFQQADGYLRHFETAEPNRVAIAVLAAVNINESATAPVKSLYPSVHLRGYGPLHDIGLAWDIEARVREAARRRRAAERVHALAAEHTQEVAVVARNLFLDRLERNYPASASMLRSALVGAA